MEITGKVIAKPASATGTSTRGFWKKAFLVIRYEDGQYPKDVLLYNLKNAEDFERIALGSVGTFKFDAKTKESQNGRWFCELECWSWNISPVDPI